MTVVVSGPELVAGHKGHLLEHYYDAIIEGLAPPHVNTSGKLTRVPNLSLLLKHAPE
jgi:hypothetical protein